MIAQREQAHENSTHSMTMHRPKYSWADPNVAISPLPTLMGKQMGQVETPGVPPLGYRLDGNVKVFHLIAQPIVQIITDSRMSHEGLIPEVQNFMGLLPLMPIRQCMRSWGYNGATPGPTIEATEGDRIRVVFKNELPEPTTIHWHGLKVPFAQDGSSDPVMPGETHIYEFTLYQSGTYFYHSGFNISRQELSGLGGMFIIHPKKGYAKHIDRHIAIMLEEWAISPGNEYPNIVSSIADFNWFTFNGHAAPSIPIIDVKQGQRVRIHLANISMDSHPIHLHGHDWTVMATEGGPLKPSARWPGSTINVPPGTSRAVEFVAWNPGQWPFHCHKMHHVMNAHAEVPMGLMGHGGMFTLFNVIPANSLNPWYYPGEKNSAEVGTDAFGFKQSSSNSDRKLSDDKPLTSSRVR